MRAFLFIAAFFAANVSANAAAQSRDALDCVSRSANDELKAEYVKSVYENRPFAVENRQKLEKLIGSCASLYEISKEKSELYFNYSINLLIYRGVRGMVEDEWLSPELVDKFFDLGPGRTNPDFSEGVSKQQANEMLLEMDKTGKLSGVISDSSLNLLVDYAIVSSLYWKAHDRLVE